LKRGSRRPARRVGGRRHRAPHHSGGGDPLCGHPWRQRPGGVSTLPIATRVDVDRDPRFGPGAVRRRPFFNGCRRREDSPVVDAIS
jgi:hypothetical protein